ETAARKHFIITPSSVNINESLKQALPLRSGIPSVQIGGRHGQIQSLNVPCVRPTTSEMDIFKQVLEGSPSVFQRRPGSNPLLRISSISRHLSIGNDLVPIGGLLPGY